jgi:hypothetical protein
MRLTHALLCLWMAVLLVSASNPSPNTQRIKAAAVLNMKRLRGQQSANKNADKCQPVIASVNNAFRGDWRMFDRQWNDQLETRMQSCRLRGRTPDCDDWATYAAHLMGKMDMVASRMAEEIMHRTASTECVDTFWTSVSGNPDIQPFVHRFRQIRGS